MSKISLKKKRLLKTCVSLIVSAAVVIGCIVGSKQLINRTIKEDMDTVFDADESYYLASKSNLAKNASMNLSYADRINLIANKSASTYKECSLDAGFITETEAVALCKSQLEYYYESGAYPYSLSPSYDNWYSWNATLYEYTDSTFNTYTVYLWCIEFIKYDNTLSHTVLMTENGTILNAEVHSRYRQGESILHAYQTDSQSKTYSLSDLLGDSELTLSDYRNLRGDVNTDYLYPQIVGTDIYFINSYKISVSQPHKETQELVIYQYVSDNTYGIGIIPADELN